MKNYAMGHCFNSEDIFFNFDSKKIQSDYYSLNKMYGVDCKSAFARQVFKESCKIIINDVIENDVEFRLPVGKKKTSLMVKEISENEFKECRKRGKFADVDFLATMFKAYELKLHMYGGRDLAKIKTVYVNKELKLKLLNYINSGRVYYGKNIKTIKDYYEDIFKLYPKIPQSDLKRILNYGWKSLYLHNSLGGDTLIKDSTFWFYIGSLYTDSLKYFNYYAKKLSVRLRICLQRKHIPWDGYYYFVVHDDDYENYTKNRGKKGRPKTNFTFKNVMCYKLSEECSIRNHGNKHIFRVPALIDFGYCYFNKEFKPKGFEEYINREPLKFVEILTSNYNYKYL